MTHQPEPIRKSSLPTTPPPEWEFHTVTGARTGTDGCALFPGDTGPVVVRRLVTYGDWEPVRPDRWADEPEPAVVSAAVAPPTSTTHGLSVQHADALWDAVAIPGPRTPTYPEQHERVCRAVRNILDELTPAPTEPADRAAVLRDFVRQLTHRLADCCTECDACAVIARDLAAAELRRMADEGPLSPYYEHPECGFHWHGRDGMDIPMQDGQPVCPRCELAKVQKQLDYSQRRRDEVGAESLRRGKIKLEQAEKIARLESQLDEVRTQLGAEILRAGQAEAELRRMAEETATETQAAEPTAEDIARAHVTSLHLIGEQLATIESWFWEHLADVRDAGARQDQTAADEPECCAHCTHPKRDHDGRADHRAKHSPLVAGDPWCHACNAQCDYATGARQDGAQS